MASRILGHPTVTRRAAALLLLGTTPSWAQGAAASSRVAPSAAHSAAPQEPLAPPKDAEVASAQSATAPAPGYGDRATWDAGYAQARAFFERGEFAQASAEFLALAQRAPTQFDSVRALELGQLAFNWHQRGLALVDRKSLVGSDLEARSSDRRTADEIGVLYTTSVVYGIATGLWFDVQSEPGGVSTAVLPPLLLAGAAVGGVALLDSGRGLRYGVAQSMASGMYIGLWQGITWSTYLQASTSHQSQLSVKQYATALWSAATLGAVVGGVVGTASSTTPGRASFVSSTSLWPAFVLGMGVAGLSTDNQYRDDHAFLAASLGATGGVVAGILTAGTISPTTARVRFLDLGGLGGTLVGGGLYLAAAGNHAKFEPAAIISALGAAAGLSVAWFATANMPRDEGAVPRTASFDVHPQISPQRGGASLGFTGTF
jgi:hypothetical protein